MGDDNSLRVAVRVRPQSEREKADLNRICTTVYHNDSQINIGGQKNFTFDHAFDSGTQQQKIYDECVKGLVEGTFDGFNATVLAYGQTGSGKTYTMGTAFDMMDVMNENDIGIVPRAIQHLFSEMESRKQQALEQGFVEPCFDIVAQFVELYNEEIIDLLSHERVPTGLRIHEDVKGEIFLNGVTRIAVTNPVQTLEVLKNGSLNRKTASTNMNKQSSRSHAIFTMIIKQQRTVATKACDSQRALEQNNVNPPQDEDSTTELELLSAKFHFVDLAGSERLKRSGATGDRAREGISINFGLLALGNVICSLTATPVPGKVTYIPYRDSKLTRLLQDSLGGNSRTVMIACISPSDCDYVETLNTLNYANRAKNIKNKVIANQDKSSKVIGRLRSRIAELEAELLDFRQGRIKILDGIESFSDQYRENVLLQVLLEKYKSVIDPGEKMNFAIKDVSQLRIRIKAMQETLEMLTARNVQLLAENSEIRAQMGILRDQNCHESHGDVSIESKKEGNNGLSDVIRVYIGELESLRCSLMESNATNEQLRQQLNHWKTQATKNAFRLPLHTLNTNKDVVNCSLNDNVEKVIACTPVTSLIQEAKADVERMKQSITESSHEGDRTNSELTDHEDDTMKTSIMVVNSDSDGDVEELKGIEDEDLEVENEAEAECLKLGDDLAELQAEISIKERLILKLEHSERRLAEVQLMYQRKIAEFSLRIKEMEAERDRVLAEMASKQPQKVVDTNHVRKIREDYEKKLATMRDEFKKLQSIEREHRKMQTKQAAKELERSRILSELNELKKAKATLLRKIKEESNRAKSHETSIMKKIAGLEKEARRKDDIIQKLQNKDRQREEALKKSFNEVGRLRQLSRQASHNSGRKSERQRNLHLPQAQRPTSRTSVEMKVKAKWMIIEKLLRQRIIQRQTITKLENELEKAVTEKNALNEEIGRLEEDYIEEKDSDKRDLIGEHIDGCHAKMLYIMEHLSELRNTMAGIDENNKDSRTADAEACHDAELELSHCTDINEAIFILKRLFAFSLEQGFIAAKAFDEKKEMEVLIREMQKSVISEGNLKVTSKEAEFELNDAIDVMIGFPISQGNEIVDMNHGNQVSEQSKDGLVTCLSGDDENQKVRRRTSTPRELLYPLPKMMKDDEKKMLKQLNEVLPIAEGNPLELEVLGKRLQNSFANEENLRQTPKEVLSESDEVSLVMYESSKNIEGADVSCRNQESWNYRDNSVSCFNRAPLLSDGDQKVRRRTATSRELLYSLSETISDVTNEEGVILKQLNERILPMSEQDSSTEHTLTNTEISHGRLFIENSENQGQCEVKNSMDSDLSDRHSLEPWTASSRGNYKVIGQSFPYNSWATGTSEVSSGSGLIVRTHILNGHKRTVLSVDTTGTTVISGSKDRTAKVWDLEKGVEKCSFHHHPNSVSCVRFIPNSHMALTVSLSFIRIWDLRSEQCVRTLHSSGLADVGDIMDVDTPRTHVLPLSEAIINAVQLDNSGKLMFTTFNNDVRIWNLEKFATFGRLSGATQSSKSEISCLGFLDGVRPRIFTGSRDHRLKMYEINIDGLGLFEAAHEFSSAHHECITSLLPYGDVLFSASKNLEIMRFSLQDMKRDHIELQAHNKWIQSMRILEADKPLLVTACKEARIKLWDITSTRKLRLLYEIDHAHDGAINEIATYSSMLFTASNDATVSLWQLNSKKEAVK